jgi:hypothetical protein
LLPERVIVEDPASTARPPLPVRIEGNVADAVERRERREFSAMVMLF